jgi:acetyl esterase
VLVVGSLATGSSVGSAAPVQLRADLRYATHGGVDLALDAYLPSDDRIHPAIILIHGGRWENGGKGDLTSVAFGLVEQGFVAVSVDYRLLPEWPYPAAVQDVKAAVRWVRAHAPELRVDPARIGALGTSAGAYLAAVLATSGEGRLTEGARVAAAASWSGPLDLVSLLSVDESRISSTIAAFLGCGDPSGCQGRADGASPTRMVDAGDAPLLIAQAEGERIPFSQATTMADAYRSASVSYELVPLSGDAHGLRNASALLDPTARFFARWLGPVTGALAAPAASAAPTPSAAPEPRASAEPVPTPAPQRAAPPAAEDGSIGPVTVMVAGLVILLVAASILQLVALRAARRTHR